MKNLTALLKLVGRWEEGNREGSVVIQIHMKGTRPIVTAHDDRDGERFRVSKVQWDGKGLSFSLFMPSTRHRTNHRLIPTGRKGIARRELTLFETWKQINLTTENSEHYYPHPKA